MSQSPSAGETAYLERVASLLQSVFDNPSLSEPYVRWLYRACPDGTEIAQDYVENERLLGHYTIVPRRYWYRGKPLTFGLSLNTAVAEEARGKGLFTRLANEAYERAKADGWSAIIGVANANSTPGFLKKLGFGLVRPLPVVLGVARPLLRARATVAGSAHIERAASWQHQRGTMTSTLCTPEWTPEKLAWRCAGPLNRYDQHDVGDGLVISATQVRSGIKFAVVLKLFPYGETMNVARAIASVCRAQRTPFYAYAGLRDDLRVRGVPLPGPLRPSPLNVIYKRLSNEAPAMEELQLTGFEFLDFDAY